MISVLLIEDHDMVREGMEQLLNKSGNLKIIASAATGKEGIALARQHIPQVVLLDYELPDSNGLEITRKLTRYCPDIRILIVSAINSPPIILQLLSAGAAGYFSKTQGYDELERAIFAVHRGQRYLSPEMANCIALRKVDSSLKTPFDELSTREMEVALLIVNGVSLPDIAARLCIAPKTVHSNRYQIFKKFGIKSDLALLRMALQYRIVVLDKHPALKKENNGW